MSHILVIEDHAAYRANMVMVLRHFRPDLTVVEAVGTQAALSALPATTRPVVALLHWHLAHEHGSDAMASLHARWPGLPVLAVLSDGGAEWHRQCLSMGAAGLVHRSATTREVLNALALVEHGGTYVPPLRQFAPSAARFGRVAATTVGPATSASRAGGFASATA